MAYWYLLKTWWKYADRDRYGIVLAILLHTFSVMCKVLTPYAIAQVLNTLQETPRALILDKIMPWIGFWILLWFLDNIFHRSGRYFEFSVGYRAKKRYLMQHYQTLTQLSLGWHADHHSGDIINRLNTSADALYSFAIGQMIYVLCVVSFVGPLIMLSFLNFKIAALALFISIIAMCVIRIFDKKLVACIRNYNAARHKISATLFDFISNMRTIIIVKLGDKTKKDFAEKIEDGYGPLMYYEVWINAIKWFFISMFGVILRVGVVFYYIYLQLKNNGPILVGNAAAVFQYMGQISSAFVEASRKVQDLLNYRTNLEEIEHIIPPHLIAINAPSPRKPRWQKLQICNVHFAYGSKKVLTDFNLTIHKGQKIALTGESGAGKSTLMYLLRGLYDPSNGHVLIDDRSKTYAVSILGTMTTLMPQDPEIFENTIVYNITMGLAYSDKQIDQAIELSCFKPVLAKLPNGLQTDIREKGVNLSGGERQRLALARNILAALNSDIILMDEPTSSIDMKNELQIFKNLINYFKDKTIIASIHRLYLTELFDRSIHMESGRISHKKTPLK